MSAIKDRITIEVKAALKSGDKHRVTTLRGVMAALKQVEVDSRTVVDDAGAISILTKLANQRRESIAQFDAGQRPDLADKERAELAIIESYLPAPLGLEEVTALIIESIARVGATQIKDMGKVMADLRPHLIGRADLGAVSHLVKARLTA
ncbi:MAG: GatB/YqeY domain-containing protein [Candidatus Binatia bacterium]